MFNLKSTCKKREVSLWFTSSCVALTNGLLLAVIGVRDRETTLSTWVGLRASGVNSFEPITVWGSPTYVQWLGLGNRLPLFGNGVNPFALLLSRFFNLDQMRLVLIVSMTVIGVHAFFNFLTENRRFVSPREAVTLFCFASPLIGISMRHSVTNDWSENALSFWAVVGIFSSLGTVLSSSKSETRLANHLVPTLAVGFMFVSFGHPITAMLFVPLSLLGILLVGLLRPRSFSFAQRFVLVSVLLVFLFSVIAMIFDLWKEKSIQTQFLRLDRETRFIQTGFSRQVGEFLVRQSGFVRSGELGYVGLSVWLLLLVPGRRLPKPLLIVLVAANIAVVIDSEITKLPLLSYLLSREPYSFSESVLLGNVLAIGRVYLGRSPKRSELSHNCRLNSLLKVASFVPLGLLPTSLAIVTVSSGIPRLDSSISDRANTPVTQFDLKSGYLVYTSESLHRGLSSDPSLSLSPQVAQAAGIATLNTYSRVRSSQTLVTPVALFENGVRKNYCINRWVSEFLQIDAVIGERFCDEGWETTDPVEINRRKIWVHEVHPDSDNLRPPCPLLELNCREVWREQSRFTESELSVGEYLIRCKNSCVARWRVRGEHSNVLFPINFDSGLRVDDQFGHSLRVSDFHGLLLVEKPPSHTQLVSGTIRFEPDVRAKLRAVANLLASLTVALSTAQASRDVLKRRGKSDNGFRNSQV